MDHEETVHFHTFSLPSLFLFFPCIFGCLLFFSIHLIRFSFKVQQKEIIIWKLPVFHTCAICLQTLLWQSNGKFIEKSCRGLGVFFVCFVVIWGCFFYFGACSYICGFLFVLFFWWVFVFLCVCVCVCVLCFVIFKFFPHNQINRHFRNVPVLWCFHALYL